MSARVIVHPDTQSKVPHTRHKHIQPHDHYTFISRPPDFPLDSIYSLPWQNSRDQRARECPPWRVYVVTRTEYQTAPSFMASLRKKRKSEKENFFLPRPKKRGVFFATQKYNSRSVCVWRLTDVKSTSHSWRLSSMNPPSTPKPCSLPVKGPSETRAQRARKKKVDRETQTHN